MGAGDLLRVGGGGDLTVIMDELRVYLIERATSVHVEWHMFILSISLSFPLDNDIFLGDSKGFLASRDSEHNASLVSLISDFVSLFHSLFFPSLSHSLPHSLFLFLSLSLSFCLSPSLFLLFSSYLSQH